MSKVNYRGNMNLYLIFLYSLIKIHGDLYMYGVYIFQAISMNLFSSTFIIKSLHVIYQLILYGSFKIKVDQNWNKSQTFEIYLYVFLPLNSTEKSNVCRSCYYMSFTRKDIAILPCTMYSILF